ncbi:MAG: DUF3108 domain-containing protein [Acidobacteriota bacterium]
MQNEFSIKYKGPTRQIDGKYFVVASSALLLLFVFAAGLFAQTVSTTAAPRFRVGEKLSYSVAFENVKDAAYFETSVVSRGKLGGKDVVELRGRLKTYDIVSAAFSLIDERRTVFADPESGLPVMIERTLNDGVLPRETTENFITSPTTNFDLLTAVYILRNSGGNGSFPVQEDGETSILTAQAGRGEKIKTDSGEYDTSVSTITGPFLDARGIKQLRINFTLDDAKLPVLIQFKTARGTYRAQLTAIETILPDTAVDPVPTPTPVRTPVPAATPKPQPTPAPYVDNSPLLPELSFALGETLDYRITRGGRPAGTLRLAAASRKQLQSRDSLTLTAKITGVDQVNAALALGDLMTTVVNPDTLAPLQSEMKFGGTLKRLNQSVMFDSRSGTIMFGSSATVDAPVGTHTLLSLVYAMRSFNLRPSKDLGNPVNDTRVAVFWGDRPYVFTLRPEAADAITFEKQVIPAQLVTIVTGNPELDQLAIKVWLSTDDRRLPLRFSFGGYQADLTAVSNSFSN